MTNETVAQIPAEEMPPPGPTPSDGRVRWLVLILLAVGLVLLVFFGLRSVRAFRHFHDVRHQPIGQDLSMLRPWMTIPDVARNFEVPPDYLYNALGVLPQHPDRRTLLDLNRKLAPGQPGAFEEMARAAIEKFRSAPRPKHDQHGPPGPDQRPSDAPTSVPSPAQPQSGAPP